MHDLDPTADVRAIISRLYATQDDSSRSRYIHLVIHPDVENDTETSHEREADGRHPPRRR